MNQEPVAADDSEAPNRPGRMSVRVLKTLLAWSLLNAAIVSLPLLFLAALASDGPDLALLRLMLVLSGAGVLAGVVFMVLPCALLSEPRFRHGLRFNIYYVPYIAIVPHMLLVMAIAGPFSFPPIALQLIVAPVLHVLMARHYRRAARRSLYAVR